MTAQMQIVAEEMAAEGRRGYFAKDENILFVHTGGSPTLYVCMDDLIGAD